MLAREKFIITTNHGQDHFWSRSAAHYERDFIDPYVKDVRGNLVRRTLHRLRGPSEKVVADLGCGIGPLLPFLSRRFKTVYAIDFAPGMLERAKKTVAKRKNVTFVHAPFTDLAALPEPVDVAVAVNSLVLPSLGDLQNALAEIRRCLKPGGVFLGIVPGMDAVHYHTMLLMDRARNLGLPPDAARKNAAQFGDHSCYDFAFSEFRFKGLEQHFWHPFEVRHRFAQAGFALKRLKKVHLSWTQFAGSIELKSFPAPWDWFFLAKPE